MARRKAHKQYWRLSPAAAQIMIDLNLADAATRIAMLSQTGDNVGAVARMTVAETAVVERLNRQFSRRRQSR